MAGDSVAAKEAVGDLIRGAGFTPVDLGGITAASTIGKVSIGVYYCFLMFFFFFFRLYSR